MPSSRLAAALALALALALAGCSSVSTRPDVPPPLLVGIRADAPPFSFQRHRQWEGLEPDLARALCDRLHRTPVFVPVDEADPPSALIEGHVELLMAGVATTPERRASIDFAMPYLVVGQGLLFHPRDADRFTTDDAIRAAPLRAGVVAGDAGDDFVSRWLPRAQPVPFERLDDALADLRDGQLDAVVHDAPALWWISRAPGQNLRLAPVLFAREEIAWGFRPLSFRLREAANQILAEWRQDGTLEAILARWIPISR
jgi:polar amino acid transport system substrate-binding protein